MARRGWGRLEEGGGWRVGAGDGMKEYDKDGVGSVRRGGGGVAGEGKGRDERVWQGEGGG